MMKLSKSIFVGLISVFFVAGVFLTSGLALEGKAGEVIRTMEDLKDLQAKGLLTEAQVILYGEVVKDFGKSIRIVETTDRRPQVAYSKTAWKATEMNKGKATIDSEGLLANYAGQGVPFPEISPDDPQAGIKAAWNYDRRNVGDDFLLLDWEYPLTGPRGNIKRMGGWSQNLNYSFRTDLDPRPNLFPGRFLDIWFKNLIGFSKPFSSKGLQQLTIHYVDPRRDSDIWVFVPGLRRVARVGGGNKCDCLGGFTFNMEDSNAWAGDTSNFHWKLLREKEHLVNTLITDYDHHRFGGAWVERAHHLVPTLERRKLWMIEQIPKDPAYCYSKRIFYQDPVSWWFVWEEMYDRAGGLWKALDQVYRIFPNPEETGGGGVINTVSGDCTDFRIWEAGPYWIKDIPFNKGVSADMFTIDFMRRSGR